MQQSRETHYTTPDFHFTRTDKRHDTKHTRPHRSVRGKALGGLDIYTPKHTFTMDQSLLYPWLVAHAIQQTLRSLQDWILVGGTSHETLLTVNCRLTTTLDSQITHMFLKCCTLRETVVTFTVGAGISLVDGVYCISEPGLFSRGS